ncbi:MAG: carbohydrate ABC transporter permease [Desulfurococcales archaeon]|nr:carbohydrate ABC transporter permease [Desulfurococcales archaeon]
MIAKLLSRAPLYAALLLALAWTVFPLYWIVVTSFKSEWEVLKWPPSPLPEDPTIVHYARLIGADRFYQYIFNSFSVSLGAALVSILLGAPAAYGLVRAGVPPKFSSVFLVWILTVRMLPPIVIAVPLFELLRSMGLLDTRFGLVIAYQVYTLPYAIWILHGFLSAMPKEVEEAAYVDGATRLQTFTKIVAPMMAPGIIAALLLSVLFAWNEFLYALIFINSPSKYTVTVIVANYIQEFEIDWGRLAGSGVLSTLPILVLSVYIQRYMIRGLAFGGIKA